MEKLKNMISFSFLFIIALAVNAQPIGPSETLKSDTANPKEIDLPYKVIPINPKQDHDKDQNNDQNLSDDVSNDYDDDELKKEEEKPIDWKSLPYLPMKGPSLLPLPDPEY